ncbi:ATP-binding protein [Candidatus Saganbacteria bacterium]|nr:ATP-binding protein [Candidatus Saganbacteria bacterium]
MKRKIEELLINRLNTDRAVAVLGPRQAGKSFILKQLANSTGAHYITLDDPLLRSEISTDPLQYLRRHYEKGNYLLIDEAAKLPPIFEAVKILIDEAGSSPSRICLANSGNYLLMKRIKESLAGRISLLSMYPLSWQEFTLSNNEPGLFHLNELSNVVPKSFVEIDRMRTERLLWGGYPFPSLSPQVESRKRWGEDYLKTYVLPIILEQFNIRDLEAFEKCARLFFLQSGKHLNYNNLAQEVGVSQPTIVNYIHQLRAMMLFISLEGYYKNSKKRLLKQPKIHIIDSLFLQSAFGSGFNIQNAKESKIMGAIYKSFICSEIIKTFENYGKSYKAYNWRTADKAEVDIVLEYEGQTYPLEIKMSEKLSSRDISGLLMFLDDNPAVNEGYIIYQGKETLELHPKIKAIPDWLLLGAY